MANEYVERKVNGKTITVTHPQVSSGKGSSDAGNYMVKWGHKGFLVNPKKVVPFSGLATSHGLKSEYHLDTASPDKIYVRSRKAQSITFNTTYLTALGMDIKNQMKQWYDLIGMTYPMYIGGRQFGPPLLQLKSVDWSNFILTPTGKIIGVDAAITLEEYVGPERLISQETFDSWTGETGDAMKAEPSKEEKKNKFRFNTVNDTGKTVDR